MKRTTTSAEDENSPAPKTLEIVSKRAYGRVHFYVKNGPYKEVIAELLGRKTVKPADLEQLARLGFDVRMPDEKPTGPVDELANLKGQLEVLHEELDYVREGLQRKEGPAEIGYLTRAQAGRRLAKLCEGMAALKKRMAMLATKKL